MLMRTQHELNCHACSNTLDNDTDCRRCFFAQVPAVNDRFFVDAVRPYSWFAAIMLFLSYLIGLWFTLRTHAAVIWNENVEEKKSAASNQINGVPPSPAQAFPKKPSLTNLGSSSTAVKESQLYKRILGQSLKHIGLDPNAAAGESTVNTTANATSSPNTNSIPHLVPPKAGKVDQPTFMEGLTPEQNEQLARQVADMAATAATVAARDAYRSPKLIHSASSVTTPHHIRKPSALPTALNDEQVHEEHDAHGGGGGHDAPNWSRTKSTVILLGATLLYAIIAEILVNTVDVVLENVDIDEKFLGITLFALVPNTTEFLVSFTASFTATNNC